jgi:protein tyrosine phosphatase (PTP) superfamily phosphohydrolase (DUF442 family)
MFVTELGILLLICGQPNAAASPETPRDGTPAGFVPKKVTATHLPNPWQIHDKVISGGLPEGDEAFEELVKLGVKTIISVDGAKPDLARARQFGLRYVHLPHGYDGVPERRMQALAKAVRDLPGTVYIHCHHGKHRSPAAAAVACVGAGFLEPARAESVLVAAGTSDAYKGLFQSVRAARRFESRLLVELKAEFPETAELPPLAEAMAALERTHDHLNQVAAAGWKSPPDHPDIDPGHESLLLREHFTEMLRTDAARQQPREFQALLRQSEAASAELEHAVRSGRLEQAAHSLQRVSANCKTCHTAYRDVPLNEKNAARDAQ